MSNIGRPTNQQLIADGKIPVSKTCKICQSGARDEITQLIINRATGREIIDKFGHLFQEGLTPTNIHSHRQHINVDEAVKADRKKAVAANVEYNETTKALFQHKYDEKFDKAETADMLYKQRMANLFRLQHEIETLNAQELNESFLSESDKGLRRKLVTDLEVAYRGFNQDLLKHIQLDADLYVKQVSLQYINLVQNSFLRFTAKLMDVLVKEIPDPISRERLVEQVGDLLQEEVAPILDPNKAIDTDSEIIE